VAVSTAVVLGHARPHPAPYVPGKGDLDVLLVNGEAQVQQLELAVVAVQQVPARGAVLSGAPHVLAQAVEGGALLGIALGVVAIGIPDVGLERCYPVYLVGGLERHREHRCLRHGGQAGGD
jgi:hypothetical protein